MYLQDLLKFEPGRQYSPALMPKGKGASNRPKQLYKREERKRMSAEVKEQIPEEEEKRLAPVSHKKLLHFLKDQRKELTDYVKETSEEKFLGTNDDENDDVMEADENDVEMDTDEHVSEISSDSCISELEWNEF